LDPGAGRAALPTLLDLAARHGIYVEVVALADTRSYPGMNYEQHILDVGNVCSGSLNCFMELGNELAPVHETQDNRLGDVNYLRTLQALVPGNVLVSLGSTHADMDESDVMKDGRYLTIHGSREDGDSGYRWVRHTNEQRSLADALNKYAVNDEPNRGDMRPDAQFAMSLLERVSHIGGTFHYGGGLQSELPSGAELDGFNARVRGWGAVPEGFVGSYQNAGFAGGPVKSFDDSKSVRVYSGMRGNEAYTVAFGPGEPAVEWNWPTVAEVARVGTSVLYRVTR